MKSSKPLDKCPEKVVASSSSEVSSSSSFTLIQSSSSITSLSSSSHNTLSLVQVASPKVQIHVSRGMLNVEVPVPGPKTLRFYDALGNNIGSHLFEGFFASVDVFGWNSSVFMQLEVDGRLLLAKRVSLR